MPNRILREGILTSARVTKLAWPEEVFYRRLHSVVDDFGRYYADLGLLRAACYPRQLNKVSDSDIGKWLHACEAAGLVSVYPAQDGERYLQVQDFGQQIRAKKSKFPDMHGTCAADAKQVIADAHLDVSVSEGESGADSLADVPPEPKPEGTSVGALCKRIRQQAKFMDISPSNPTLLALIEAGYSHDSIFDVCEEAAAKGKSWGWAAVTIQNRAKDAKAVKVAPAPEDRASKFVGGI